MGNGVGTVFATSGGMNPFGDRPATTLCLVIAGVFAASCDTDRGAPPSIESSVGLTAFTDCAELEQYIEDTAVRQMRNQLDSENFVGGIDVLAAPPEAARGNATQSAAPTDYTRTNTQVAGVDEADFVKTNGTHIFTLSGRKLYIAKSWPAAELAVLADVEIEGHPAEMFLEEDTTRVSVISDVGGFYADGRMAFEGFACSPWGCGSHRMTTKVTVIDASDPAAPRVTGETYIPGAYQSSRRIDHALRLVINDQLSYPDDVRMWPDAEGIWDDEGRMEDALAELADKNEAILRSQSLADWLPDGANKIGSELRAVGYTCTDFSRPNAPMELGLTTIATIDTADLSIAPQRTSIVARTHLTYASRDALYLAGGHWWWWPRPGQRDWTYLFKLDLRDPTTAPLVAAGGVDGHIINQFAIDEHQGNLRVATTIAARVEDDDNPWGRVETTNRMTVLEHSGDALSVLGRTRDVATGERIYSARFVADKGFMVTFRQVDPLFTVDLSDPRNPEIVGELKVPGFSTYIHPIDDDHLLTIGVHVDETSPFAARTVKLTLFDVSDFAHPTEKFTQVVGTAYGWSEAVYEHKAFNYFAARGLLAIPFSDWMPNRSGGAYWNDFVSQVRVFEIDVDTGITAKGGLAMDDLYRTEGDSQWQWWWSPWVRRSVMADGYVYAISDAGIRVAQVDALVTPLATVLFDGASVRR